MGSFRGYCCCCCGWSWSRRFRVTPSHRDSIPTSVAMPWRHVWWWRWTWGKSWRHILDSSSSRCRRVRLHHWNEDDCRWWLDYDHFLTNQWYERVADRVKYNFWWFRWRPPSHERPRDRCGRHDTVPDYPTDAIDDRTCCCCCCCCYRLQYPYWALRIPWYSLSPWKLKLMELLLSVISSFDAVACLYYFALSSVVDATCNRSGWLLRFIEHAFVGE